MEYALLTARLLLAAVFAVAAITKFADRENFGKTIVEFGVPVPLSGIVAGSLPVAELLTALALLPTTTAWGGAIAALVLLLAFTNVIGISLIRGRKPLCHCFGQVDPRPIGWSTLARNLLFIIMSAFIVFEGGHDAGPSVTEWFIELGATEQIALFNGLLAVVLGGTVLFLLLQLIRQNGRLLLRIEALERMGGRKDSSVSTEFEPGPRPGLPVGSDAPEFLLTDLTGNIATLTLLTKRERSVLLLFTDGACGPCNAMLPEVADWQSVHSTVLRIVLIDSGRYEDNRAKQLKHGINDILLQRSKEVAEAYHAVGTPSAVLVHPNGRIGSLVAQGIDEIRELVITTTSSSVHQGVKADVSAVSAVMKN